MPELPEVQTTVNGLLTYMKGQTIKDVWTDYNSPFYKGKINIKNPEYFKKVKKIVIGAKVTTVTRRAKNILIQLDNKYTITIHMKMTGHILHGQYVYKKESNLWIAGEKGPLQDPFNRFIHLVFTLSNGKHIVLSDMRKFAKVALIKTSDIKIISEFKKLGPEPLSPACTLEIFINQLSRKPNGKIKSVLMDQEIIAGIGNIYSDEILWSACIHPERRVSTITKKEFALMYIEMKKVLEKSLSLGGDSMSDYRNINGEKGGFHPHHNAYRQHGKPCLRKNCKGILKRLKIGGRSAHYCETHQKMA